MTSVYLSEIEVEVQPELAEEILKKRLSKEYFCWLILKKLDETMNKSCGKIGKKKAMEKLIHIVDRTRYTITRYLNNGDKIFWRFNKDKSILYLNSFSKVCLALDLVHVYSYNIIYSLKFIEEDFDFDISSKSLLMAAIASKTGNPVSNMNLADRGNVCKKTVQNYLSVAVDHFNVAHKVRNYQLLSLYEDFLDAQKAIGDFANVNGVKIGSIRIRRYKNKYWLLKQIPNSIINKTGRSSIKQEKQKLRDSAGRPPVSKHPKIYIKSNTEKMGLEFFCMLSENDTDLSDTGELNVRIFLERGKE